MKKRRTEEEMKEQSALSLFIREKRKNLGLTQNEISLRVGVGLAFYKRLEGGDVNLQLAKVLQVLAYLGAEMVPAMKNERELHE